MVMVIVIVLVIVRVILIVPPRSTNFGMSTHVGPWPLTAPSKTYKNMWFLQGLERRTLFTIITSTNFGMSTHVGLPWQGGRSARRIMSCRRAGVQDTSCLAGRAGAQNA